MYCSKCGSELQGGANFCSTCGLEIGHSKDRQKVSPGVVYGGYLSVGGWLSIAAGAIVAIFMFTKADSGFGRVDDGIVLTGVAVFVSMVIYAWLYFGLHKALLKITRIEQALGITEYQEPTVKEDDTKESNPASAGMEKKDGSNDPGDVPWELRGDDSTSVSH